MASEANEKTPLLPLLKELPGIHVKPFVSYYSFWGTLFSVPLLALQWHWVSICFALLSAVGCWSIGWAQYSVVDPMIFKSIFVVFGFASGFRNVRANQRYGDALNQVKLLFGSAWGVIALFRETQADSRPKVELAMIHLLNAIVIHLQAITYRTDSWYALVGLHPTQPDEVHDVVEDGLVADISRRHLGKKSEVEKTDLEVEVALGPRPLMVSTFVMIGNEICRTEALPLQERKRTFWHMRLTFFTAYDFCEMLTMPSVTAVYQMVINFTLFLFGLAVPWGISVSGSKHNLHTANENHEDLHTTESLKSLVFIVFNTFFCMIILFGLNALAHENEQPFRKVGITPEAIELPELLSRFATAVRGYEARFSAAKVPESLLSNALSRDNEAETAFADVAQQLLVSSTIEDAGKRVQSDLW